MSVVAYSHIYSTLHQRERRKNQPFLLIALDIRDVLTQNQLATRLSGSWANCQRWLTVQYLTQVNFFVLPTFPAVVVAARNVTENTRKCFVRMNPREPYHDILYAMFVPTEDLIHKINNLRQIYCQFQRIWRDLFDRAQGNTNL